MRRREFIALFVMLAARPRAGQAQQNERMRQIGILMGLPADDPEALDRLGAFERSLNELGWTEGQNLRIHYRRGAGRQDVTKKVRR